MLVPGAEPVSRMGCRGQTGGRDGIAMDDLSEENSAWLRMLEAEFRIKSLRREQFRADITIKGMMFGAGLVIVGLAFLFAGFIGAHIGT